MKLQKKYDLLTAEKMDEVKSDANTDALASLVSVVVKTKEQIQDKKRELSIDKVLNICVQVTGVPAHLICGLRKYKYNVVQDVFYTASFCYTGFSISDIAAYAGCQCKTVFGGLTSIGYTLADERKFVAMAVILECEKLSHSRLAKNIQTATIQKIKGMGATVEELTNPILTLRPDKIKKVPLRPLSWFDPGLFNTSKAVFAYRTDGKRAFSVDANSASVRKALFELQDFGYRLLPAWGEGFVSESKDCENCYSGRSGKCPAAVMESYFCSKKEYDSNLWALAGMSISKLEGFKAPNSN